MEFIADLHLHSKYSRAVSPNMNLYNMALWGTKKGLDILTTGDWTHPLWLREIKQELEETSSGLFEFKTKDSKFRTKFILTVEISSIYSQGGKVRRVHNLVFSPSIETSEKIQKELIKRGCNISSDGRPIIGLSSIQLMELIYSIDENVLLVPCHAWTPWFALYGSNSGFDSIDEAFGDYADKIYGIETGLSSDPYMNWQIKELENRSIISTSDAHSLPKMGREATIFVTKDENQKSKIKNQKDSGFEITYQDIINAIKQKSEGRLRIGYTTEFYPEEGKYHYTGHRNCSFFQDPKTTREDGSICPICRRALTVGVMHRVEELAKDKKWPEEIYKLNPNGVKWILDPTHKHPPFVKLVPLYEIIAESLHTSVSSQKVKDKYEEMCKTLGSEFEILLKISNQDLEKAVGPLIAEGISKVRTGDIVIQPGFDGQYGIVKIWQDQESRKSNKKQIEDNTNQLGLDF
jgi:uncharacterized protein (TIGR00375 family)